MIDRNSFSFQVEMATGWLKAAKNVATMGAARFALNAAMNAMRKALAAANRAGDNGQKAFAFSFLNRMRAQYRAVAI